MREGELRQIGVLLHDAFDRAAFVDAQTFWPDDRRLSVFVDKRTGHDDLTRSEENELRKVAKALEE